MVRKLVIHFLKAMSFTVVISPAAKNELLSRQAAYSDSTFLDHDLRLVNSNKMEVGVQWSMRYNDAKFRMSSGKYYLDMASDKRLTKVSGGDEIENDEQEQQLKEIKEAIREDRIRVEGSRTPVGAVVYVGGGQNGNGANERTMVEPIVERRSMLIDDMGDSAGSMLSSNLADNEGDSTGGSTTVEKIGKNSKTDKVQKTESTENESISTQTNLQSNLFGSSIISSGGNATSSSNVTSSDEKSTSKTTGKGFVFDIIPTFTNNFLKTYIIKKADRCLTHNLMFEECNLDAQKPLPEYFYWDIYRVDDAGVLGKIKDVVKATKKHHQSSYKNNPQNSYNTNFKEIPKPITLNRQEDSSSSSSVEEDIYGRQGAQPGSYGQNPKLGYNTFNNRQPMLNAIPQNNGMQYGYNQLNGQQQPPQPPCQQPSCLQQPFQRPPFQQPPNSKLLLTDDLWRKLSLAARAP